VRIGTIEGVLGIAGGHGAVQSVAGGVERRDMGPSLAEGHLLVAAVALKCRTRLLAAEGDTMRN